MPDISLIDKSLLDGLSEQETQEIKGKITDNIGLYVMIISLFSTLFEPDIDIVKIS